MKKVEPNIKFLEALCKLEAFDCYARGDNVGWNLHILNTYQLIDRMLSRPN